MDDKRNNVTIFNAILEQKYKYYDYLRREIEREDGITHQRLTWILTFQGFLISAVTAMLALGWSSAEPPIPSMRWLSLGALAAVGLAFGHLALKGVMASRRAISCGEVRMGNSQRILEAVPRLGAAGIWKEERL
jgi:hypothetical protein